MGREILAIGLIFLGCCSNVVFLELLIKEDPASGNIITFLQFLFIALEGGIFVTHFGLRKSHVPLHRYFVLVGLFFVVSILNNYALNFDIPLPLHMIFRSGSLIANMVLGIIIMKKRYPLSKYIAVVMITVGIAMATLSSANQLNGKKENSKEVGEGIYHYAQLIIGISMLLGALFASARMGLYQEVLYAEYGKHPREAMFYMHALPLPGFILLATDIWSKIVSFSISEPIVLLGVFPIPKMWAYILGNSITQYICIRGVFILTSECPSLIVTLVVTLRKFVSLLFSIFYFQNPFTFNHWVATAMVFTGSALFTGVFGSLSDFVLGRGKGEAKRDKGQGAVALETIKKVE